MIYWSLSTLLHDSTWYSVSLLSRTRLNLGSLRLAFPPPPRTVSVHPVGPVHSTFPRFRYSHRYLHFCVEKLSFSIITAISWVSVLCWHTSCKIYHSSPIHSLDISDKQTRKKRFIISKGNISPWSVTFFLWYILKQSGKTSGRETWARGEKRFSSNW
jgi:hypothetical protein